MRERNTSVLRAGRVPNPAKRLNVVQRPKTLFEPQRSMTSRSLDVRHAPAGVPGEGGPVQARDVHGERIEPEVDCVLIVDRAVEALLLPHKLRVVVDDRAVAIVRVVQRPAGLDLAILPGARA